MATNRRRTMLIGSGIFLALAGGAVAQAPEPRPRLKVGDQWNHGDDPWDSHPGNYKFNPEAVGIIHLELLNGFRVKATRFHYKSVKDDNGSSWEINGATAIKVINWLNGPRTEEPPVDPICHQDGLEQLIFGRAHHVVVYIKNENIKYPDRPIWFGNSLQGTVVDRNRVVRVGRANENHSFFKTAVLPATGESGIEGDVSRQFIYFQNHFHKHGFLSGHDPIQRDELKVYSMKISIISQSMVDDAVHSEVPIIIDPDTGNMGGGAPLSCD